MILSFSQYPKIQLKFH